GSLMIDSDAFTVVSEILHPETFYDPRHQKIYRAIQTLSIKEQPVDMLTVEEELKREGSNDDVGGAVYLAELTMNVSSSVNIESHATILKDKYMARQLISYASEVGTMALDEGKDIKDVDKIKKGDKVYVVGRLRYSSFMTEEGVERPSTEIVASKVSLLAGEESLPCEMF
ncbi:MAG: single-stranded DNA-binding protein, partial [Bacteroidales bacterium]|nr:single-stranded DNA-binding protein [Bacteroidales bacterium]